MKSFRAKGQDNEREQARAISLWLSKGNDKDLLWRSDASGARSSTGKIKGAQYGDLCLSKHEGQYVKEAQDFLSTFCVELKHIKEVDILKAWMNDGNDLRKHWQQCTRDADANKVNPMLIVRPNRVEPLIFLRLTLISKIRHIIPHNINRLSIKTPNFNVMSFLRSDFFGLIRWRTLYEAIKEQSK